MRYLDQYLKSDDPFKSFVIISLLIHFSFLILLTTKDLLFPGRTIEILDSIRVDVVALPDKPQDIVAPEPAAPPEPTPINKKEAPAKVDVKASQKKALEKLQALSALEKIKNEVAEKNRKEEREAQPKPAQQFKGNIVSSGNSYTGMSRLRVNEYLQNLTASVKDHWVLPQWLNNTGLKAAIVISIDSNGNVIKREIHISSGNEIFDSSCLAAVSGASPFAPPPSELQDVLMMIRFPFE